MTRVLYMSDLHLEMESFRLAIPGWAEFMARHRGVAKHPSRGPLLDAVGPVDLVVLAGDIHNGLRGVVYAEQVSQYLGAPVVLVAGNHEYYHHNVATLLPAFREAVKKTAGQVYFLENEAAVVRTTGGEKIQVLGCTLWTDFALYGDPEEAMINAQVLMNDYRFISLRNDFLVPWNTRSFHEHSLRWLHGEMAEAGAGEKTIIVTHHAPSGEFLGTRQGKIAPAYASDIIGEFSGRGVDLWIHGHTHYRHDSVLDGVRLVSAPRGYVGYDGENALQFRPGIVDI